MLTTAPRRSGSRRACCCGSTASCSSLVIALLVGLTVAIYNKAFVDVVHVTLKTDRVGNQLAPPADVKLRGHDRRRGARVSSDGEQAPPSTSRCSRRTVGLIPANVDGAAAAQDAVRREVRRPACIPRAGRRSSGCPRATSSRRTAPTHGHRARAGARRPAAAAAHASSRPSSTPPSTRSPPRCEGRGERLGREPRAGRRLLHRLNPELPDDPAGHRAGSPTSPRSTPTPRPTWCGCCATSRSPRRTIKDKSEALRRLPRRHRRASPTTTRQLLDENDDRIIQLAAVGRPTLAAAARGTPRSTPACSQALTQSNDFIGKTFANGELHITLEVTQARKGLRARARSRSWDEHRGPELLRPAEPAAAVAGQPLPGRHPRRRHRDQRRPRLPASTRRAVSRGTAEEQRRRRRPRRARRWACRPTRCPTSPTLLFGPMARGTAVGQS